MKHLTNYASVLLIAVMLGFTSHAEGKTPLPNYVFVKGAQYDREGQLINVGDFEIADHPVSNAEYKLFTDATKYPVPPYWDNGTIPKGKEDYPVIYVNREDAETYAEWLTTTTGRIHRIPTRMEFEYATRGGENNRYGFSESMKESEINYNTTRNRHYNHWEDYLKPAVWGQKNPLGLYQMMGNVWQFITDYEDPAVNPFKFRIEHLRDLEGDVMGGSWASTKEYVGQSSSISPGTRTPDRGIRLVREPVNAHWSVENRKTIAVTHPKGGVALSWALLSTDTKNTHFNIYRLEGSARPHNGQKLNDKPLYGTSYHDTYNIQKGTRYQYRVVTVDEKREKKVTRRIGQPLPPKLIPIRWSPYSNPSCSMNGEA